MSPSPAPPPAFPESRAAASLQRWSRACGGGLVRADQLGAASGLEGESYPLACRVPPHAEVVHTFDDPELRRPIMIAPDFVQQGRLILDLEIVMIAGIYIDRHHNIL